MQTTDKRAELKTTDKHADLEITDKRTEAKTIKDKVLKTNDRYALYIHRLSRYTLPLVLCEMIVSYLNKFCLKIALDLSEMNKKDENNEKEDIDKQDKDVIDNFIMDFKRNSVNIIHPYDNSCYSWIGRYTSGTYYFNKQMLKLSLSKYGGVIFKYEHSIDFYGNNKPPTSGYITYHRFTNYMTRSLSTMMHELPLNFKSALTNDVNKITPKYEIYIGSLSEFINELKYPKEYTMDEIKNNNLRDYIYKYERIEDDLLHEYKRIEHNYNSFANSDINTINSGTLFSYQPLSITVYSINKTFDCSLNNSNYVYCENVNYKLGLFRAYIMNLLWEYYVDHKLDVNQDKGSKYSQDKDNEFKSNETNIHNKTKRNIHSSRSKGNKNKVGKINTNKVGKINKNKVDKVNTNKVDKVNTNKVGSNKGKIFMKYNRLNDYKEIYQFGLYTYFILYDACAVVNELEEMQEYALKRLNSMR